MMVLGSLVLIPLLGALVVLAAPSRHAKWISLIAGLLTLVPLLVLINAFDAANPNYQMVAERPWIPDFGINIILAVDGLSLPMVVLTGLLSLICIIASWNIQKQVKGYYALFLLLQASMTGVFLAVDLFLFYVFWELMLLPMYFLIGIWGAPSRVDPDGRTRGGPYAAIKFFIYTLIGSLLMLVAILWLWSYRGTFDMRVHESFRGLLDIRTQLILWGCFFLAFAVKIPMFPFHTWLPDAHVEAPTAISVILAGVLLKMGTYGILRVNYSLFPKATLATAGLVAIFGAINILYGALCAMAQTDMKRLVAYSSISHMGYVMLGMSAVFMVKDPSRMVMEGMLGGVLQMWNHGTITAMLFLLVGVIYDRVHHRDLLKLGGLATTMPIYTAFVAFAFFASLGLPGLSGFIGEALVLLGAWRAGGLFRLMVVVAAVGIVITAAYHLWMIQRAFLAKETSDLKAHREKHGLPEIEPREIAMLVPLVLIIVWIGVYPAPMLNIMNRTLMRLVSGIL